MKAEIEVLFDLGLVVRTIDCAFYKIPLAIEVGAAF